jgi:glycine C-acetyltransferase
LGGYFAGPQNLKELLIHKARPFLFSTSHPPSVTAASMAAIDVLLDEPDRITRLWDNTRYFKSGLKRLGLNTGISESPITPVIVGEGKKAMDLSDGLFRAGVFAQGIGYPTVAEGKARVRTIVTSEHSQADLDEALAAFERVGRDLGILTEPATA